jgi:hypothetical protein
VQTSDLIPGARFALAAPVDLGNISIYVPEGATGTITYAAADLVCFRLDEPVENLHDSEWENELMWSRDDDFNAADEDRDYDARAYAVTMLRPIRR